MADKILKLYSVLKDLPESDAVEALSKWIPKESLEKAYNEASQLRIVKSTPPEKKKRAGEKKKKETESSAALQVAQRYVSIFSTLCSFFNVYLFDRNMQDKMTTAFGIYQGWTNAFDAEGFIGTVCFAVFYFQFLIFYLYNVILFFNLIKAAYFN
jgi:hypothetical protein